MGEAIVQVIFQDRILETVKLDKDVIVVGRLPENDVFINNLGVSRKHCRIMRDQSGNYTIEDLGSANGTLVNGVRINHGPLYSGDEVQVGKHKLVFQLTSKGVAGFFKDEENRGQDLWVGDRTIFTGAMKSKPVAPPVAPAPPQTPKAPALQEPPHPVAPVINISAPKAPPKEEATIDFRAELEGRQFGVKVTLDGKIVSVRGLEEKELTIGRDPSNDLVLDNLAVSVRHARIAHHDKQYVIEDLGSANGIRVNGVNVKRSPLYPGDEILVGRHLLVFDSAQRILAAAPDVIPAPVMQAPPTPPAPEAAPLEALLQTPPQIPWDEKYSVQVELDGRTVATYALKKRVSCIGRLAENDVPVDNIGVSRLHAQITIEENDQVYIEDQDSANGIIVNGLQLKRSPLYPGDVVQIMKHKLIFGMAKTASSEKAAAGGRISTEAWRMDSTFMVTDEERQKKIKEWTERAAREQAAPPVAETPAAPETEEKPVQAKPVDSDITPVIIESAKTAAPPVFLPPFSEPTPLLDATPQTAKIVLADGKTIAIKKDVFIIGKGADADLKVGGPFVKQHHVVIKREGGRIWSVTDFGLFKRAKLNGKAVKSAMLKSNDEIVLGDLVCRFVVS